MAYKNYLEQNDIYPKNIAYADPPYVGQARKHYGSQEVDHKLLIKQLQEYNGWALSCSSPSLKVLLPLCPNNARIGAWVKPFAIFKVGVNPAYTWEPVIFVPARNRMRYEDTIRDWVSANITLKKGLVGVKPKEFSFWLFSILGMWSCDRFYDLFPGTGAVGNAWQEWKKVRNYDLQKLFNP